MSRRKLTLLLCFGAIAGFGFAHLSILPPWEGMDEHAHYGHVQYLADGQGVPRLGGMPFSRDIMTYMTQAPMPYSIAPYITDGFTYRSFFAADPATIDRARRLVTMRPEGPRRFEAVPGTRNWQAQHPPLYYLLLAPVYDLTRQWALRDQLFVLRSLSFGLALIATMIGVLAAACWPADARVRGFMAAAVVAWPIAIPMWTPEMARLGNDGLCALWVATAWLFLVRITAAGDRPGDYAGLGLSLGLGALTKAFLLPISAGAAAFLLFRLYRLHRDGMAVRRPVLGLSIAFGLAVVIAGWWYVRMFLLSGDVVGGTFAHAKAAGVTFADLAANFSLWSWLRGTIGIATSFVWSGTWSFIRPDASSRAVLLVLPAVFGLLYILRLRRTPAHDPVWLPLFLLAPFVAGLLYHGLVWIALRGGQPMTNGWYLHIFFVPVAAVFGLVASSYWHRPKFRVSVLTMTGYALVFSLATFGLHALLFTGYAVPGPRNRFAFADAAPGFGDLIVQTWDRLTILGAPGLGVTFLAVSLGSGLAGAVVFRLGSRQSARR